MKTRQPVQWACATLLAGGMLLSSCRTTRVYAPAGEDRASLSPARPAAMVAADPAVSSQNPVVMLLVDEKNLGTIPTAEVEALGAALLIRSGCRVVDQDMLRANIAQHKQMLEAAGDNRGAAAVGLQFGANVVLAGNAVCKPAARRIQETNLRSYQAVVTIRAIRSDDASVIASASEVGTAMDMEDVRGGSKALKGASQACFDKLIPAALAAWKGGGGVSPEAKLFAYPVHLTLGGVEQLWKVKAIRESLRGMNALDAVVQRSYSAGAVVFEARSSKRAEELAEDLVMKPPQGLKLQVLSVEAGKIVLRASDPAMP